MSRRKYQMGKRAETVESTRRRILEATMAVHDEQGIIAGRWPDIAERAGVSLATIYRHFPTLEDLVTACGELTIELLDLPSPEQAKDVFRGARSRRDRIERLVQETFSFYERAGRVIDNVRRVRRRLAVIEQAHEQFEAALGALAQEALRPLGATPDDVQLARALTDVRVWEAMRERGLGLDAAVDVVSRALRCALPNRPARLEETA